MNKYRREALQKALDEGPRSLKGDPAFESLAQLEGFFTPAEVVWLVNQALYHADYQRAHHRKRQAAMREARALAAATARQTEAPRTPGSTPVLRFNRDAVLRANKRAQQEVAATQAELDADPTLLTSLTSLTVGKAEPEPLTAEELAEVAALEDELLLAEALRSSGTDGGK